MRRTNQARRSDWWLYHGLLVLLSPLLFAYTAHMAWRWRDWRYLRERLGYGSPDSGDRLWLHAASVGEVNAALPLLRLLIERHPDTPLLVTTTTPSGARVLDQALGEQLLHAYLPIDWRGAVRRFLLRHRPRALVVMETELWPRLWCTSAERGLPLVVVNARLSSRTLRARSWLKRLYAEALSGVSALLARADADRDGYLTLGMDPARSRTLGNIKFAGVKRTPPQAIDLGRDYLLLASSRDHEEREVVAAWQTLDSPPLLVVAPRHPERRETILNELAPFGLDIALRSRNDTVSGSTDLYLADTFGELAAFMQGAEVVVMGGSFVAKGGHNLLEPAALGRAVIVGPHMENFASECERLRAAEAVIQVTTGDQLASTLQHLLDDTLARDLLARRASEVMLSEATVAERYLTALEASLRGKLS